MEERKLATSPENMNGKNSTNSKNDKNGKNSRREIRRNDWRMRSEGRIMQDRNNTTSTQEDIFLFLSQREAHSLQILLKWWPCLFSMCRYVTLLLMSIQVDSRHKLTMTQDMPTCLFRNIFFRQKTKDNVIDTLRPLEMLSLSLTVILHCVNIWTVLSCSTKMLTKMVITRLTARWLERLKVFFPWFPSFSLTQQRHQKQSEHQH